ncbi:unnamed protein product [Citrullus colocynthis]|uniref:Uncharacterized protein n=1 Tax=Citrullus colocynthis TaxID=252529 RepID=A0ABP0Y9R7_9ROSI
MWIPRGHGRATARAFTNTFRAHTWLHQTRRCRTLAFFRRPFRISITQKKISLFAPFLFHVPFALSPRCLPTSHIISSTTVSHYDAVSPQYRSVAPSLLAFVLVRGFKLSSRTQILEDQISIPTPLLGIVKFFIFYVDQSRLSLVKSEQSYTVHNWPSLHDKASGRGFLGKYSKPRLEKPKLCNQLQSLDF